MKTLSQPIILGPRYTLVANFQSVADELQELGMRLTAHSPRLGSLSWDANDLDVLLPIMGFCVRAGLKYGEHWLISFQGVVQPFDPTATLIYI